MFTFLGKPIGIIFALTLLTFVTGGLIFATKWVVNQSTAPIEKCLEVEN